MRRIDPGKPPEGDSQRQPGVVVEELDDVDGGVQIRDLEVADEDTVAPDCPRPRKK